jgi:hypothetical protein
MSLSGINNNNYKQTENKNFNLIKDIYKNPQLPLYLMMKNWMLSS